MQGLAVVRGTGLEFVVTLGTGVGTALFRDGELMPHLELAHHPVRGRKTHNEYLGDRARKKTGARQWTRRVRQVDILHTLLNYDRVYIGGGNARRVTFDLDRNMRLVSNDAGILGGIALWKDSPRDGGGTSVRRPNG
jgi:polyphosphate glucokinase